MINRTDLEDYFMFPYICKIGTIYPVKISDYSYFKMLSDKYIIPSNNMLKNLYSIPIDINIFDYYVENGKIFDSNIYELYKIKNEFDYTLLDEENKKKYDDLSMTLNAYENGVLNNYSINEMIKLLEIIFRKQFKFTNDNIFRSCDNEVNINRDNYYELREIVMYLNILHEVPTSNSKTGNLAIQSAIKHTFGESTSSLSSICSVVKCNSNINDEELLNYSYYRLMYDFSIINRQHGNIFSFMLRSQGCSEVDIDSLDNEINLHKNPYDSIFNKHTKSTKIR